MFKLLLIVALSATKPALAGDLGPLLRIVDGDTYEMLIEGLSTRVRLANADTPETGRKARCESERLAGDRATSWVRKQVATREVAVFPLKRLDKYRRQLVHVRIDGEDLGGLLVKEGLARPYAGERRRSWCNDEK